MLLNKDSSKRTLPAGFTVMGVGKSKWTQLKSGEDSKENAVPFILTDDTIKVLLNGAIPDVGTLVARQTISNPAQAKVCYYDLVETPRPGKPSTFQLKQKVRVATSRWNKPPSQTLTAPA